MPAAAASQPAAAQTAPPQVKPQHAGSVRLFFGQLSARVTPSELAARLAPFGTAADVTLVPCKAPGGGLESDRVNAFLTLTPQDASGADKAVQACISTFNGCSWQGTRLVVGRAKEDFQQRLNRERQAAQHAAAATAAALEERRRQIAAAPVDVAELDRQLQNTELWLRGPGGKWVSVGACGGLGSHKRSFQRYQPDAAAGAPDTGLGRHASFRAAAQTAGVASDDPWARLFRKVSVLDDIDDQPDDADFLDPEDQAEDDVREEREPAGRKEAAVEPPAAVEAKPMPPQRSVAAAREKASATPEAMPRRAARQLADASVPKPVVGASAPPEKPRTTQAAPVEVYTAQARDDALAGERAQQLALLARLGFGGGCEDEDEDADTAAPRVVAPPASRVARPIAHGFSSSSEEGAGEPAAEHGTGAVQSQEEVPKVAAPQQAQAQKAAKPRRTPQPRAVPAVLADDAAWGRALRLAAGEDVDDEAAPQEDPPPAAEPPRKRRRSRVKQAAAPGEGDAVAAPAAEEESRAARVRQALAATRLGEGRAGVYFADTAFDWRSLAVEAGQQTWSLLGGAAEGGASMPAAVDAVDVEPMPMQAPAAAVPPPAQAFKPVDLAALGVSFARRADGAGDAKAAWQAQRDVLWADVKRKKREVKRKR